MGPTGSDVGRGTAAGYVNMQTKTPHLARRLRRMPAAPPIRAGHADINRAPSANRDGSWVAGGVPRERAVAGQRRRRPRHVDEREPRGRAVARARPRHADARVRRQLRSCGRTTCRTTASRAPPGQEPLAPTSGARAAPVDQTNYYGSAGYDYDRPTRTSSGARRARHQRATLTVRNQTRYNRTAPRRRDLARSRTPRPTTRRRTSCTWRARATSARTGSSRTRRPSGPLRDRPSAPRRQRPASRFTTSSSSRRPRPASARAPGQHLHPQPASIRSPATRRRADPAYTEGGRPTRSLSTRSTRSDGAAPASVSRRAPLRALRHRVPRRRRAPVSRPPT